MSVNLAVNILLGHHLSKVYTVYWEIFVSLYFHKFCSVVKLNFAKVLPCHTFYVAHMDHYFACENIFWEIIENSHFLKNLATRKFPGI